MGYEFTGLDALLEVPGGTRRFEVSPKQITLTPNRPPPQSP